MSSSESSLRSSQDHSVLPSAPLVLSPGVECCEVGGLFTLPPSAERPCSLDGVVRTHKIEKRKFSKNIKLIYEGQLL